MKQQIIDKFSITCPKGMTLLTPFSVSKKRKILYFHIAKTGGSTIHNILRANNLDDGVLSDKKGDYGNKLNYFKDVVENWDSYLKFTFVRNKYDLLYSLWNYDGRPSGTFDKFIEDVVDNSVCQYGYWIDQYYLTVINGTGIFDFVGRQERFNDDLKLIFDKIGDVNYNSGLHLNSARYDHSKHFSNHYTDRTKDIIYRKFKSEIDFYGFTLDENYIS